MGKGWPFHKTKNNHEASSSRASKRKKARDRRYIPVDYARQLFDEGYTVPWSDVNLPGGWLLNSRRVPVPRERRERHNEIRRFILPLDLREDLAFDINSYNWHTFG